MNLVIVDSGRKISHSRYVSTFRLSPCEDSRSEIVTDIPLLRFTSYIIVFPRL
jgi:hypothetical protein